MSDRDTDAGRDDDRGARAGGGHEPVTPAEDGESGDTTTDTDDDRPGVGTSAEWDETGRIEAVFLAPEGSAPMERHESVAAVEGGLEGDRYRRGTGHYSPYDVCEVTLIDAAAIETIRAEYGIDLSDGRHRRNLVVRGLDLESLLGATVRVGEAVLRGTRPRPPCAHVEEVADEAGVARALNGHGGICASVVQAGTIAVGDRVRVEEPDPWTVGREIAGRLAERRAGDDQ
jgi:MOSC domain-containing protein YiiM